MTRAISTAIAMMAVATFLSLPVAAQTSDYFVPSQQRPAQPQRPAPRPGPQTPAPAPSDTFPPPGEDAADQNPPMPPIPMPPVPNLPALAKVAPPPAAAIGVISVPDVMHASTAAQQIDKVITERRQKLQADAQKEQAAWRDISQALARQRTTMSPDQIRAKERDLQQRIISAQHQFRDRNLIIQEAAQFGLNQIQSSLIGVIRQIAESHSMNLVLHRQDVALNVNGFDITDEVTSQLNKILPSVTIPPDGVSPLALAPKPAAKPAAAKPATAKP
jgi:Skp family chaperone for outer membrane proteins